MTGGLVVSELTKLTYSVSEAARVLGISRTTAYECVHTGQLRSVRLGRRLVIPKSAIDELLAGPTSTSTSVSA